MIQSCQKISFITQMSFMVLGGFVFWATYSQNKSVNFAAVYFILGLIFVFLNFLTFRVDMDQQGIRYQMYPFGQKKITYSEIDKIEWLNENPYWRYWGFGIRYRYKETAYFLQKEKMLKIHLKTGNTIVLGVNDHLDKQEILTYMAKS